MKFLVNYLDDFLFSLSLSKQASLCVMCLSIGEQIKRAFYATDRSIVLIGSSRVVGAFVKSFTEGIECENANKCLPWALRKRERWIFNVGRRAVDPRWKFPGTSLTFTAANVHGDTLITGCHRRQYIENLPGEYQSRSCKIK